MPPVVIAYPPLVTLGRGGVHAAQLPYRLNALLGQGDRQAMGMNVTLPGLGKQCLERRINRFGLGLGSLTTVAARTEFVGNVDQAAGVDGEIGRVDNAPLVQRVTVRIAHQLVVGPAANNPAAQVGNRLTVKQSARRTWSQDVTLLGVNVLEG